MFIKSTIKTPQNKLPRIKNYFPIILTIPTIIGLSIWAYYNLDFFAADWTVAFRPATLELLAGRNPYALGDFYNPPWVLLPFIPLAPLHPGIGAFAIVIIGLFCHTYVAYRLGGDWYTSSIYLLSPAPFTDILLCNINWMIVLGFTLPPKIGLFFLLAKPQLGLAVALYWAIKIIREKGVKELIKVFAPVTTAFIVSIFIFGMWPLESIRMPHNIFNISFWPWSFPIGLVLLVYALRKQRLNFSMISAPFFSPYIVLHNYSGALLGLIKYKFELVVAVLGLWIAMLIH